MSYVAPGSLRVALDSGRVGQGSESLRAGQIVYGRVVQKNQDRITLDVLGQHVEIQLSENVHIGATVPLRVQEVSDTSIEARVISTSATEPGAQTRANASGHVDVAKTVRRLVDAATSRFFGNTTLLVNPKVLDLTRQSILRVSIRGERPRQQMVSFEPEALAISAALAGASSEELLAAQAALERLAVPATPLTMAAALPEANSPGRLVSVLARMSAVLAELTPQGRLNTLRTLAEFLSQIRPHEQMIDAQISSFVDQIASGGERKLFELLTALSQRSESSAGERLHFTARATERATSLTNDMKTQLLAASNPAHTVDSTLASLLTEALEVVTAAQLTSLNAQQKSPGAIAFVLPIASGQSTLAAQVTVARDTPEGRNRMLDADNFRIMFSLETKRLGPIYIEIESVARALRVTIEAQTTRATDELRMALDQLRTRFSGRGYRTVAMTAHVAQRPLYRSPEVEEQRTYVASIRSTDDAFESTHLDTRA